MARSARSLWTAKLKGGTLPAPAKSRHRRGDNPVASAVAAPVSRGIRAIILGIDPSLRGTGLAVIDTRQEQPRLLESRTVKLGPKLAPFECLGRIADAVEELVRLHGVKEASIEETIFVQNFRTAQAMGASRGAALSPLARLGVKVSEYAPKRIKMAVTGHGAAKKDQVGRMIQAVFGLRHELPLDESDATAAALCHAYTGRA